MNEQIKFSIDARKNAFNSFDLSDEQKKEIDGLFSEIEKLGATCKDAGDFEAKFSASPLNQKYMDMFTKIATEGASKNAMKGATAGMAASAAESAVMNAVGSAVGGTIPTTRAAAHQKAYDAARDIPVVGDAIDISQKASYLGHLGKMFKKKS